MEEDTNRKCSASFHRPARDPGSLDNAVCPKQLPLGIWLPQPWELLSSSQRALGSGNEPFPVDVRIQDEQRRCCGGDGVSQLCPALGWAPWSSLGRLSQCIPAPSSAPGVQEILPSHSLLSTGRVELSQVAGSRESSLISQGWELNHSCHELLLWRTENPTRR